LDVLGPYSGDRRRFIRLNPDLRFKVPKLDEVAQLNNLRQATIKEMQSNMKIKEIAHRLIASTFFFEKVEASTRETVDKFECRGIICCRFHSGSEEMKALGRFLYKCLSSDFEPYFVIQEDRKYETMRKLPFTEQVIGDMCVRGKFAVDRIHITVSKQLSATTISLCLQDGPYPRSYDSNLPISGFPRTLMTEDIVQKHTARTPYSRNSGSFNKRPHRRHRHRPKPSSSGNSSPPQASSLRRSKSQSNLRQAGPSGNQTTVPHGPEDVADWLKRRKSVDTVLPRDKHPVFELADTSPVVAPSEMTVDPSIPSYNAPLRRKSKLRFVI